MAAEDLRRLSGIYRRSLEPGRLRSDDPNTQRRHEPERSREIGEYIRYGYPWSELTSTRRASGRYDDLRKPGWLPTAIVLNILEPGDVRDQTMSLDDAVQVTEIGDRAELVLPSSYPSEWDPRVHPFEVIDGQHRLWAFGAANPDGHFDLPVVAFKGLHRRWQAYLFWTINITPKRINASLAYDLYPLLRSEEWLERFEGHAVYRESRAQELVEAIWAYPESPWYQRINMLGERGAGTITQASWVRSLLATFVRSWGVGRRPGGLFGAPKSEDATVLPWNRAQQASVLIYLWERVASAVLNSSAPWAQSLREADQRADGDPAFFGSFSLLSSDQGVRGVMHIANDLLYLERDQLRLSSWVQDVIDAPATDFEALSSALSGLSTTAAGAFIDSLAVGLADYDFRTFSAPGQDDEQKVRKAGFRGSGGYREIRLDLLRHLTRSATPRAVSEPATSLLRMLSDEQAITDA
jgi:DGQHR domain-containing protein